MWLRRKTTLKLELYSSQRSKDAWTSIVYTVYDVNTLHAQNETQMHTKIKVKVKQKVHLWANDVKKKKKSTPDYYK